MALPGTDRQSIKQTEWTYALMMHFSQSLGVNCTYCHNSRAFGDWSQSTPQRVVAWHGIRMVRDLNDTYMDSLHDVFPRVRRGPTDDVAKINCATCHQGVFKPLYGVSMVTTFPELKGPLPPYVRATPAAARAPDPGAGAPPIVAPTTTALPPALEQPQPTDRLAGLPGRPATLPHDGAEPDRSGGAPGGAEVASRVDGWEAAQGRAAMVRPCARPAAWRALRPILATQGGRRYVSGPRPVRAAAFARETLA